MEDKAYVEIIGRMLGRGDRACLKETAVKDGVVYVSDGRIAWKYRPEKAPADYVPADYPIEPIENYMRRVEACEKWYDLDPADVLNVNDEFSEKLRDEHLADIQRHTSRYVDVACPRCGDTVYFDSWTALLVEEKDRMDETDPRDVDFPVQIVAGDRNADISFSYLYLIGDLGLDNIEFGFEECVEEGCRTKAYFRTKDERLHGILMPLYTTEPGTVFRHTIHAKEAK